MFHWKENEPLHKHTTLRVGGVARFFAHVTNEQELDQAVGYAQENNLPITVLGGGSNVLVSDEGLAGLTILMQISGITTEIDAGKVMLTAAAGEQFDDVVAHAVGKEYWGLENLSHIPGSTGAVPVQNVGAYGVEVADLIASVRVYNITQRKYEVLTNTECSFGYRDSIFKKEVGKHYIVTEVTFLLTTEHSPNLEYKDLQTKFSGTDPSIQEVRDAVIEIRSKKFPDWHVVGTAGSFFKNPVIQREKFNELKDTYPELPGFPNAEGNVKVPLGWILDKVLHLKGVGSGNVEQYQGQALVLVNKGGARASEIIDHANSVAQKVYDTTGIEVEWEVTKVGF